MARNYTDGVLDYYVIAEDIIERAEVNCEGAEFVRKLRDYLLDAEHFTAEDIAEYDALTEWH